MGSGVYMLIAYAAAAVLLGGYALSLTVRLARVRDSEEAAGRPDR